MKSVHEPVMLDEVMRLVSPRPGGRYIDATLGGGGYTAALLKRSAPDGVVLAIDSNEQAIKDARVKFGPRSAIHKRRKPSSHRSRSEFAPESEASDTPDVLSMKRISLVHGNFRTIDQIAHSHFTEEVDGIVFDLGLSSDLLERSGRGFSFDRDEPLAMTFSKEQALSGGRTAKDILNTYSPVDLERILDEYGETRYANKVARAIIRRRKVRPFERTVDLVATVQEATGRKERAILARIFQAFRIEVNEELESLTEGLLGAWSLLAPHGRIAVVSFHSLEDRIVKRFFRDKEKESKGSVVTKKPLSPSGKEVARNPRSRSAKLRAAQKT